MLEAVNRYVSGALVPLLLMGLGAFFLIYLRGVPVCTPRRALRTWRASRTGERRASLRAVCLALAGTLGVGNLAGVAGAIALGGAGAVFWMWVSAILAMVLKYAEIVLAMRYRKGGHGSTMETLCAGGFSPRIGRWLSVLFAFLFLGTALSMGSGLQANAVARTMSGVFGLTPLSLGLLLAGGLLLVLCRGREGVLGFCAWLVPLMTLLYVVLSVGVLILRWDRIPSAFSEIVRDAFAPDAAAGGAFGFLCSRRMRFGVMRGLISNEAGCGTAPTAHASADGVSPAGQGVMGAVEVFVDTLVLCSLTALVVLVGDASLSHTDFMMMTVTAFTLVLGEAVAYPLALSVLCFGFATLVCWAHYGIESVRFLSPRPLPRYLFLCFFLLSVILGSLSESLLLWQLSDLAIGLMTLINLLNLFRMRREIKAESETLES